MRDSSSPFHPTDPSRDARDVIAQSIEIRESSRVGRLHRTLQALLDTTRANPPASTAAFEYLLGAVLDAVMIACEAHMGNLQLVDAADAGLRIRVHRGFGPEFLRFFARVPHGLYACGSAFDRGEACVIEDIAASPLFSGESLRQMTAARIKSCQSLPLIHEGRPLGVISVHYQLAGIPQRSQETFASTASLIPRIVFAASLPPSSGEGAKR